MFPKHQSFIHHYLLILLLNQNLQFLYSLYFNHILIQVTNLLNKWFIYFKLFKSLCINGGLILCKCYIPSAIYNAIFDLIYQFISKCFFLCNKSNKVPPAQNSVTINNSSSFYDIPINYTKLGCLYIETNADISLLNSFK